MIFLLCVSESVNEKMFQVKEMTKCWLRFGNKETNQTNNEKQAAVVKD